MPPHSLTAHSPRNAPYPLAPLRRPLSSSSGANTSSVSGVGDCGGAAAVTNSQQNDIVDEHEIDKREHAVARRARRRNRRMRHGSSLGEVIKEPRRYRRTKRQTTAPAELAKSKTKHSTWDQSSEEPAHLNSQPDKTERLAHIMLRVARQKPQTSEGDRVHSLRSLQLSWQSD